MNVKTRECICMYNYISASLALKLTLVLHCTLHIAFILPLTCYNIYIIFCILFCFILYLYLEEYLVFFVRNSNPFKEYEIICINESQFLNKVTENVYY